MATILCLETATTNCSVAIAVDGKIIALREENNQKFSHAEKLHVFIDEVLKKAKIDNKQLNAIAVSKGPGSYTGLRIGVSAAKGLCFALDIPLISTLTLEVIAQQVQQDTRYIIPMIDARRMEVYSAVFNSEKKQIRETKAEILNDNFFEDYLNEGKVVFIGDGALKFEKICKHKNAVFLSDACPSASDMAILAEAKYKISDTEDVAYFEPFYLKEFMMG
ncbi:universal bacterial protein YeaZ [Aequorivita sublithincola DSM 14238]|uniref:Universal bacterial protein YeaZ n=1 Tax=Aequorivita sublithincola (strain DSM 14238 / LMG 21431 / ACAM 643 / 9-3) TaxID=746697 RepID=I3YTP4_AEQSU|nr:tRNA (adenosine(37)-N6)-threonylcarbamoyltransferase complex dimerization subunit type 1 TsaB [Aequorivita sublithincola]AFL80362.1 universal bacterial protein YeaZ [Aequorivita sublithincola DSM 14238]